MDSIGLDVEISVAKSAKDIKSSRSISLVGVVVGRGVGSGIGSIGST